VTYHNGGMGEIGTFKQNGGASVRFTVNGLQSGQSTSVPAKIRKALLAIPGVRGADAAWVEGGAVLANLRMAEGSLVDGTAATIRREAAKIGPTIGSNVVVSVPVGGAKFTSADVVRTSPTAPVATPDAAPAEAPISLPAENGSGMGLPMMAAIGAGLLAVGLGGYFLLRKKPGTKLTVAA